MSAIPQPIFRLKFPLPIAFPLEIQLANMPHQSRHHALQFSTNHSQTTQFPPPILEFPVPIVVVKTNKTCLLAQKSPVQTMFSDENP